MSDFTFLCHVLTGCQVSIYSFLLLMYTCTPHVCSPPSSTVVSFAPFFLSYCVREGSLLSDPVRMSLILPGEPDVGVRLTLLTS